MADLEHSDTSSTDPASAGLEGASDGDLIRLVRDGDSDAYEHLFLRHREVAIRYARRITSSERAEDLCAEAFAKILDLLQRGKGPDASFRAYLLTTVRTSHLNTLRTGNREHLVPDHGSVWRAGATTEDPDARFDQEAVCRAFVQLPERWQAALWLTTVEGLSNEQVGLHLGIKTNAVASLAFRARAGLRQAYLAQHLLEATDPVCRRILDQLPNHVRGTLGGQRAREVDDHLAFCHRCTRAALELAEVETQLGALIAPLALGGFAAATVIIPTKAVSLAVLAATTVKGLGAGVGSAAVAAKGLVLGVAGQTKAVAAAAPSVLGSKVAVTASVTAIGLAVGAEVVTQYDAPPKPPAHSAPELPPAEADGNLQKPARPTRQPTPSSAASTVSSRARAGETTGPSASPTLSFDSAGTGGPPEAPTAGPRPAARSMAVGQPTHQEDTSSGTRWEAVSIPVTGPADGATLVVSTTRTLQTTHATTEGTGWACGVPLLHWLTIDFLPTSRFTCRYTSSTATSDAPLRFTYRVAEHARLTAVLTPPAGFEDESTADNSSSVLLRP